MPLNVRVGVLPQSTLTPDTLSGGVASGYEARQTFVCKFCRLPAEFPDPTVLGTALGHAQQAMLNSRILRVLAPQIRPFKRRATRTKSKNN